MENAGASVECSVIYIVVIIVCGVGLVHCCKAGLIPLAVDLYHVPCVVVTYNACAVDACLVAEVCEGLGEACAYALLIQEAAYDSLVCLFGNDASVACKVILGVCADKLSDLGLLCKCIGASIDRLHPAVCDIIELLLCSCSYRTVLVVVVGNEQNILCTVGSSTCCHSIIEEILGVRVHESICHCH